MGNREILQRLYGYVRPHWLKFAVAMFGMAVVAVTEPGVAALMQPMIDGSFIDKDPNAIVLVPLGFIGLFLVRGLARITAVLGVTDVATRVVMTIRLELYTQLQQLPQRFMDDTPTGRLLSKVTYDVEQLSSAASHVWIALVRDTLTVAGLLGYMFYLNWRLSLLMLVAGPVIALIIKLVSKKMRKSSHGLQRDMGDLTHRLEESIKGHKLIKLYQAEAQESRKFRQVVNSLRRNSLKLTVIGACNSPIVQLVIATALASVVYFAASQEGEAAMTPGQFFAFFTAMGMLFAPMRSLTSVTEPFQKGMAAAETVFGLLDAPRERDNGTRELRPFSGHVRIEGLSFGYHDEQPPVLRNIDLEIRPGETIALVGPSGSGKTSLTQLLPRFYDPQQGRILLDGIDARELTLASLRQQIAYVDQEVLLFDESIAENVAFGDPAGPDPERVRQALKHAHALEFVDQLEGGIDARIGEQGTLLSGGQRQRLALARAFYKDAPLLILDEATSALDNASERQVQAALEELCQNRSTIVIAHRLSTIEKADRILVMEQGEIRERGSHAELMTREGAYQRLYRQLH